MLQNNSCHDGNLWHLHLPRCRGWGQHWASAFPGPNANALCFSEGQTITLGLPPALIRFRTLPNLLEVHTLYARRKNSHCARTHSSSLGPRALSVNVQNLPRG